MDHKTVGDVAEVAFQVSGFELGGLLGSLVSDWASEKMTRGRRIPIIDVWLIGVMESVSTLFNRISTNKDRDAPRKFGVLFGVSKLWCDSNPSLLLMWHKIWVQKRNQHL